MFHLIIEKTMFIALMKFWYFVPDIAPELFGRRVFRVCWLILFAGGGSYFTLLQPPLEQVICWWHKSSSLCQRPAMLTSKQLSLEMKFWLRQIIHFCQIRVSIYLRNRHKGGQLSAIWSSRSKSCSVRALRNFYILSNISWCGCHKLFGLEFRWSEPWQGQWINRCVINK